LHENCDDKAASDLPLDAAECIAVVGMHVAYTYADTNRMAGTMIRRYIDDRSDLGRASPCKVGCLTRVCCCRLLACDDGDTLSRLDASRCENHIDRQRDALISFIDFRSVWVHADRPVWTNVIYLDRVQGTKVR
jgi:hypothetical protein